MKWSGILALFGLSACSSQSPPVSGAGLRDEIRGRVRSKAEPAVLFVGNSYSFGMPKAFSKLAAASGERVRTGHATSSGWSLKRHSENPGTMRKIREGGWDIVVLQEHSSIPALPARRRAAAMFPPLRLLAAEVRRSGAIPVLFQTWGRLDGEKGVWRDDFHKMTSRVREGYQAASRDAGGLFVVPVGDAWEREFSAGRGDKLFMPDGSHPSAGGSALAAEVFHEALFGK